VVRSRPALAVSLAALALSSSACGGSGHRRGGSSAASAGVKFAVCMRAHGVSNFPDPSGRGGINLPSGMNPGAPSFQRAQHACRSLMPGGGPGQATEQQKEMMLALSRCMRGHGVSGFPDPVSSAPANPTGFAIAFGRPGSFIVVPDTIDVRAPTFRRAARACHLPGA
jgi:hypothetical protein